MQAERRWGSVRTVIERLLAEKGLSVHAFHRRVGGNRTHVYQAVRGFSRATVPQREKIAEVLGTSVDVLFDERGIARCAK
jgi:transcriptional regulator with XRE-family HTH domain